MKPAFWSMFAALLFGSCTKNDFPTRPTCLLSHLTITSQGYLSSVGFFYGPGDKLDSTVAESGGLTAITVFHYDPEGQVVIAESPNETSTFSYNNNHQRIRDSSYTSLPTPTWTVKQYTYNSVGQLAQSSILTNGISPGTTVTYTYPNTSTRNFSSYTSVSPTGSSVTTVEYDPHAIPDDTRLASPTALSLANNYITKITTDYGNVIYVTLLAYEFNSSGYPTLIQTSNSFSTTVQTLTYTCH